MTADGKTALGISVLLAVLCLAVFGRTAGHEFVNYDDDRYVTANPRVQEGFSAENLRWAATGECAGNWHPLTVLSHMLDWRLYDAWAGGHHLTSVFLHATAAVLCFLMLRRMTGRTWPSALAAALFAVHPLRVESVAWVSERKDVLSGVLFMATLWAYAGYVRRRALGRYLLVAVLFALGLMAKPMLVTLPALLLVLDWWPLGRLKAAGVRPSSSPLPLAGEGPGVRGRSVGSAASGDRNAPAGGSGLATLLHLVLEKLPLILLAVADLAATMHAQKDPLAMAFQATLDVRIGNALVSCVNYVLQSVVPMNLSVYYPHPGVTLPHWQIAGAALLLIAVSAAAFALRRRLPYLLAGWLWYLGMLVPVIGLVQVGSQARADRYTYLPQLGLAIAAAWGLADLAARWPALRRALAVAACLVVAVLAAAAFVQTGHWRNSESLWRHALKCDRDNPLARLKLAMLLVDQSETNGAKPAQEAEIHLRALIRTNPDLPEAHLYLALALWGQGRDQDARQEYAIGKALEARQAQPGQ